MTAIALLVIAPAIFVYYVAIKGADRYEPEPNGLLLLTFLWGALVATFAAVVLNQLGQGVVSLGLGMPASAQLVEWSVASFVAPLVEETTKGLGLLLLWVLSTVWLQEFDGPLDGVIYGGMIGLGFTLTEDVLYVARAGLEHGGEGFLLTFVLRTVLSGFGHASFTAMTGLGVGIAAASRRPIVMVFAPILGWSAAVGLHSLHNLLATFFLLDGTGLVLKLVLFWIIDVGFFALLLALSLRDRIIVARELATEVGRTLSEGEYRATISRWMLLPGWNRLSLRKTKMGYAKARKRQLALIELAFAKHRGPKAPTRMPSRKEVQARAEIASCLQQDGYFC